MIKRIIAFSVYQRWLIVLLTALASAFGAWSLSRLPIDAVPDITNNQVQINTLARSLSANEIEKQITYPIENALAGIPGLEYTRSLSRNGFSQVTAVFGEKVDIYFARQQVNERLMTAKEDFPPGVEVRMGPIATGLSEIYMWTVRYQEPDADHPARNGEPGWQTNGDYLTPEGQLLHSDVEKQAYLRTVQDWIIKPQLRTVPGVASVDSLGGYQKQYHVQPDPAKLFALGLSFNDVAAVIERNNVSRGAGYIERNGEGLVVRSGGRLETVEDIRRVVVATRNGVPVRIGDIAEVGVGRELRTGSASMNGEEVVIGTTLMLIGANSRTVSAAVDAKMGEINKALPPGVEAKTILNRTLLVDATIKTVAKNLAEGAFLVIIVLFALLGNFRAALITALVIPITMLLLAIGMVEGHISANLMSMGALDFGLIADGAVIIAENSLRHLAERQHAIGRKLYADERLRTVIESSEEMIKPSVYGQAIIILVYVPLLTFSGVEGKMFQPMSMTVIIALASAFVLSLTFVPAMIAILITGYIEESENWIVRSMKRFYRPWLDKAVAAPLLTVAIGAGLFVFSLLLFTRLGQEFIPTLDEKNIAMQANRIPSASLTQSQAMQFEVENTIHAFPEVAYVFSKTGTAEVATDPMPPNLTDTFIFLKPQDEWPDPHLPKDDLIRKIQAQVDKLPGNAYEFSQPIQLRFNELLAGVRGDIAVKVFGEEFDLMLRAGNQIAAVLRSVPGATDVKVEQVAGLPLLEIKVNKPEIARLGLSLAAVQDAIGAAIGGQSAGVVFEGDRRFPIIVRLKDALREDAQALENIPVSLPNDGGRQAPTVLLKQVASFDFIEGQNQISRENGKRRVVVSANVRGRDIASVVAEAQAKVAARVTIPPGYWVAWGGQFENLAAARQRLQVVVPVCFFMIFLLLYSALGGVRDALLVFSAVPLALSGGIAALWLRGMPMSVSAAVGFIALSGIAVLNGLVMRTYIRQLMDRGLEAKDAIIEGAMTRLRPVAMTALVASLGFVPMALATGTGAEVQRPIATVVIGGLISATLLTLLVLPALYTLFGEERRITPAAGASRPLTEEKLAETHGVDA
jgi:cobalt-zinc-cadmium resistance protein CzcA